ncbi:MAG: DUF6544 family protein [Vicinamibacterales bacterium]
MTALGLLSVVRSKPNAAPTRGELIRYMAELPLLPDAMLHNCNLAWREIDASTIAITASSGETACEVVLGLGPGKRIISAFCTDRASSATPPFAPIPWRGAFSDWSRLARHRHDPRQAYAGSPTFRVGRSIPTFGG